jgi:hypothetical protein
VTGSKAPAFLLATSIIGGLACAFFALAGRLRWAFLTMGLLVAALLVGVNTTIIPKIDPFLSPRAAAPATPVEALGGATLAIFEMNRSWEYGLDFYLDRALPEWTPSMPAATWVWTTRQGAADLASRARLTVIARLSAEAWLVRMEK